VRVLGGTPAGSYAVTVTASTTTGTPVVSKTAILTLKRFALILVAEAMRLPSHLVSPGIVMGAPG
jgi:hypothetical protein